MNKQLYSTDIVWYDESVYNAIMSLDSKYPNAIPVFGGALGAYNYINSDTPDLYSFVCSIKTVAENAVFYKWHEGAVGAIRRFCHLCYVDPMLIEAYIGATFEDIFC